MAERLAGRTAVVTGASSGIGESTARTFAAAGAKVALLARNAEALAALEEELPGSLALPVDVSDPAQVEAAIDRVEAELGPIDAVVNSAGVAAPTPLAELDPESWRRTIDINLSGSFYVAREAGLRMVAAEREGSIVNLGSELSVLGMGMFAAYCAGKAGLIGLTKALAAELAPRVRVNIVCPGPVLTPMYTNAHDSFEDPEGAYAATLARVPLGRVGTPEEIAAGILYLTADASLATGAVLHLDGGTTV
jgi:NAD(P)-dependent dehydrogenase (short-subunit alcohol dehydrogenase family)